jgi:hypothetical protein
VATGFLALSMVSQDNIYRSSALLICLWATCLEVILFFTGARESTSQLKLNTGKNHKLLAVAGCAFT